MPLGMMDMQDPMPISGSMIRANKQSLQPRKKSIAVTKEVNQSGDAKKPVTSGSVKLFPRILKGSLVSVVRIPVPIEGQNLYLELRPRNFKGKSTSAIFIQDASKRHIRLDYGYNKSTGQIDYHWNQKGLSKTFKVTNHQPAGQWGKRLYKLGKTKYVGTTFIVFVALTDIYDIVVAEKPLRQISKVAGSWSLAFVGCQRVGSLGAGVGFWINPLFGTIILGGLGCIAGGIGGGFLGDWTGGEAYDFAETYYYRILQPERVESFDNQESIGFQKSQSDQDLSGF